VFLYDGAIVPDPEGIITAGHDNRTARTVAVREGEGETIPAAALAALASGRLEERPSDREHAALGNPEVGHSSRCR
jgi:hypothetical protein